MEQNNIKRPRNNSSITGVFFIVGGLLLLIYKMGVGIPSWLFSWPVILIAIGIMMALQSQFKNPGAYIMMLVGSLFLADQIVPELNLHNYIAPISIISLGVFFIFRRKHHDKPDWKNKWKEDWHSSNDPAYIINSSDAEYLDSTSVFGGTKKVIVSKNFKGGDITCFMGGAEIDLGKADIQGRVVLDVTNIFGGTKLNVPPHWDLKSEITAVFGSVEDKRSVYQLSVDPTKILILTGTAIFGGIEINSY